MRVNKKLKLTVLITERDMAPKITKYLKNVGVDKYFLIYALGSANSSVLDYLGIGETKKDVIIYPCSEDDSSKIMEAIKISEFLKSTIAFRVPIKGISSLDSLKYFLKEADVNE